MFLAASTPEIKTLLPEIIGVAAEQPGKSTLQAMPSIRVQLEGRSFSSVEPLK